MIMALIDALAANFLFLALHLSGSSSFPPPLSAAEERRCLERFREGDMTAKSELIEHNLRLVVHVIKKYYSACEDQDDLISVGTVGLIKAVNTFNAGHGTRLATYAARCIENEILMQFRSRKKSAHDISVSEPIDVDSEGNPLTLLDVIATEDTMADDIDRKIKTEAIYKFVENMKDEREKQIIVKRYGLYNTRPYTQAEVARMLNISRSYVSRIEKRVLLKMRKLFK
ncbi:MAG: RNA polymerase sporulation sigma factor SigK [Clostridiales bacterium]|nr:RNA polymerase sporulation sigma factor SigK [Clostridiales bacterium]